MIAATNGTLAEAFRWFERLSTPQILASGVRKCEDCRIYVPNNSSDVKQGGSDRAEKRILGQALTADLPVHYFYEAGENPPMEAQAIAEAAKKVSALGWGIDLVAVNAKILTREEILSLRKSYQGQRYEPVQSKGTCRLREPTAGSFDDLVAAHQSSRNTFDGLRYTFPVRAETFREANYRGEGVRERHSACLRLLRPDSAGERFAAFDPRFTSHIASWLRGYLCARSQRNCPVRLESEIYVAGHIDKTQKVTPPRFSYLPLPSIGHEHADGLVRRVIVAEPYNEDGTKARWASQVLDNARLQQQDGITVAECRLADPHDPVFSKYTTQATSFQSVTPVILPGFDDRNYVKAEKLFIKAFRQAGFSTEELENFALQKSPFLNNGCRLQEYRRPKHLQHYSIMHVKLMLKHPIQGPLALGAGRHRGLGLFAAIG
jgi:CRISPR-associated protein Csb2